MKTSLQNKVHAGVSKVPTGWHTALSAPGCCLDPLDFVACAPLSPSAEERLKGEGAPFSEDRPDIL